MSPPRTSSPTVMDDQLKTVMKEKEALSRRIEDFLRERDDLKAELEKVVGEHSKQEKKLSDDLDKVIKEKAKLSDDLNKITKQKSYLENMLEKHQVSSVNSCCDMCVCVRMHAHSCVDTWCVRVFEREREMR